MNESAALDVRPANTPMSAGRLRFAHLVLFSLNLGLILKLEGNQRPNRLFSFFDFGEIDLKDRINGALHLHPHHAVGGDVAFLLLAVSLAVVIFLVIGLSSKIRFIDQLFRLTAGIISLTALSVAWLIVANVLGITAPLPNPPRALLSVELCAVVLCAVAYLNDKWPIPAWITVVLLGLHFGYWNWIVSGGSYFWRDPFRLIFPLIGFLATLLWGMYVKTPSQATRAHAV